MTDHYSTLEAAFRTLAITELPAYFPAAKAAEMVTKSDDTVYDRGHDYYLTTYPGAFPVERLGVQSISVGWEILVDLLTRWKGGEAESWDRFILYRSDIFNLYNVSNKGRNLNRTAGVFSVTFGTVDRPRYIPLIYDNPDSPPAFIAQTCVATITEVINKT